jgi:hypothetical protein
MRPSIPFTIVAAVVLAVIPEARASPRRVPPIQLVYTRSATAAACPDAGGLRSAILKEMGYDPFDPSAARKLDVAIDRLAGQYVVTMEMRDEADRVVWTDDLKSRESCRTLVEAVGLSIVIHIDPPPEQEPCPVCPPPAPSPPPAPPSSPPSAEVPEATPKTPEPPAAPPPEAPPKPLLLRLGAAVWGDYGSVPQLTPGIALSGGVRYDWFSATLEGRWDPPAGVPFRFYEVDLDRLTGGVVLCAHRAWFAHCAVAEVGFLQSSANVAGFASHGVVYGAFGTRLAGEFVVWRDRLFLQVAVDLLGAVMQTNFAADSGLSSDVPHLTGGAGVGLLYTIEKP